MVKKLILTNKIQTIQLPSRPEFLEFFLNKNQPKARNHPNYVGSVRNDLKILRLGFGFGL
jgi:hypothetical protein